MNTYIFKRKENGSSKKKKKKKLQYCPQSKSYPKNQHKIKAAYCGSLVQGRKQSPQGTIPLFCETKQKATVKGAVWQKGEFLQTPRAHLGLSPCLLSRCGLEKSHRSTPMSPSAA